MAKQQKILIFQQNGKGKTKAEGIVKHGGSRFQVRVVDIDADLPPVIDDSEQYLPAEIDADLVLDYLIHPDLSHDLAVMCAERGIPVVAAGKKHRIEGLMTPPTCCGLSKSDRLGMYGEFFGAPELEVTVKNGIVESIRVLRGAPCGSTWKAAKKVIGIPIKEALTRIGLETQYACTANPAGWDPIHGKSPVHFAGHMHKAALKKAWEKFRDS